jgi:serine/threonine protein kinase
MRSVTPFITPRAPECFNDAVGGVSTKCDIFSFGIILWELVTRMKPWEGLSEFQVRAREADEIFFAMFA